jgi:isohexenylglutaconyl-CoA hydratase
MQLPDTKFLELALISPGIIYVTLARQEFQNTFNQVMIDELAALMHAVTEEPNVRVVVFRGTGGIFSAGGDLGELTAAMDLAHDSDHDVDSLLFRLARGTGELLELIDQCPKIVISVLEGPTLGTGLGIAAVSDVVLTERSAVLALPEVALGFSPSQISPFVARRIGYAAMRMLSLTATRIDAAEAYRLGLSDYLAADSNELEACLLQVIDTALACEPGAVANTKTLIHELERQDLGPYLDGAARVSVKDMCSAAGREGLNAFISRTAPSWRRRIGV